MKRIWILLLVLGLVFIPACSNKATIETEDGEIEVEKDGDTTVITTEDTTVEVADDVGESVDIPNSYDQKVLPIYKNLTIVLAMENDDGSVSLVATTDDHFEKVVEYYKEITEDASIVVSQVTGDMFLKMGDINGHGFTVSVAKDEDEDYETAVTLTILPEEMGAEEMDASLEQSGAEDENEDMGVEYDGEMDLNGMLIPDTYPDDIVPIMLVKGTRLMATQSMQGEMMIGFMVKDDPDEVAEYYSDILKDSPEYMEMDMGMQRMISGTIDGQSFNLIIMENQEGMEDPAYKTLVQLMYTEE